MRSLILLLLKFVLNHSWVFIELQTSVGMMSWKSVHGWVAIYSILLRTNAIFSNTNVIERIIDLIKPAKEKCYAFNGNKLGISYYTSLFHKPIILCMRINSCMHVMIDQSFRHLVFEQR